MINDLDVIHCLNPTDLSEHSPVLHVGSDRQRGKQMRAYCTAHMPLSSTSAVFSECSYRRKNGLASHAFMTLNDLGRFVSCRDPS